MEISAALATDLALLSQALEDPGVDLEAGLRAFAVTVKRAVASYTGLTMTIALDGHDIRFTIHNDTATRPVRPPATSLLIPLPAGTPTGTSAGAASTLLLYAATPGAFVDLAADLSHALGIELTALILDGHLDAPAATGITGLDTQAAINQAIGVLIDRGHSPETALQELHRLAALDHGDLRAAADAVVSSVRDERPDNA